MFSICESHFDFAAANPSRVSTLAIWSAPYAAFNAVVADDDAPPVTFTNAYWSRGRGSERSNVAFGITMALNSESSFGAVKMPTAFSVVARPSGPRKTNESPRWMPFAFANVLDDGLVAVERRERRAVDRDVDDLRDGRRVDAVDAGVRRPDASAVTAHVREQLHARHRPPASAAIRRERVPSVLGGDDVVGGDLALRRVLDRASERRAEDAR